LGVNSVRNLGGVAQVYSSGVIWRGAGWAFALPLSLDGPGMG